MFPLPKLPELPDFSDLLTTPQPSLPQKASTYRSLAPLGQSSSFLSTPLTSANLVRKMGDLELSKHPLLQGHNIGEMRLTSEIDKLKRENPECVTLIDYSLGKYGSRIPDEYKIKFVERLIVSFKQRVNGRSPEEIIRLAEQPCFKIEADSVFFTAERQQTNPLSSQETKKVMLQGTYESLAMTIIEGIDTVYRREVISENGILKNPKILREIKKWSKSPCNIRMKSEDYKNLTPQQKISANQFYVENGLPSETALYTFDIEGGKRKTKKKRKQKNKTKKVNVRKRK